MNAAAGGATRSTQVWGRLASAFAIAVGVLVLAGWSLELPLLTRIAPSLPAMMPNTAVAFLLAGVSLWFQLPRDAGPWRRRAGQGIALVVALFGLLVLAEYLLGRGVGIDRLLFARGVVASGAPVPGRPSPHTALAFLCTGLTLALLDVDARRGNRPAVLLASLSALLAMVALLGYVYGLAYLYGLSRVPGMALHTAITFLVLTGGLLLARPDRPPARDFLSSGPGGTLARRLMPALVLVPLAVGLLHLLVRDAGVVKPALGVALPAVVSVAALLVIVGVTAGRLDEADAALRSSKQRKHAMVASALDGVIVIDQAGRIVEFNPAAEDMFGYTQSEIFGKELADWLIPPDLRDPHRRGLARYLATGEAPVLGRRIEIRAMRRDGSEFPVELAIVAVDRPALFIGYVRDLTERRRAEQALEQANRARDETLALLDTLFSCAPIGLAFQDRELRYVRVNHALAETDGLPVEAHLGRTVSELLPALSEQMVEQLRTVINTGVAVIDTEVSAETPAAPGVRRQWLASYYPVPAPNGDVLGVGAVVQDVTERKHAEEQLAHQAMHDALTGLANRGLFTDRLEHALARAKRHLGSVAVLFCDLDRFKVINDSLGHPAGDEVLLSIARRLQEVLRPEDTVARLGGDEFAVLCEDLADEREAVRIAQRLACAIEAPITGADDGELVVTASIGIALSTDPGFRPETLLRDADAAMYRAKERGRARLELFDATMRTRAVERLAVENELRQALQRGQLRVFYQAMVDLRTGAVAGFEALVRWQHPARGLVAPGDFIAIAEETGLIAPMGVFVLEEACHQAARWLERGSRLTVAVNVSARQLTQPDLVEVVAAALTATGMDPSCLILELTESILMDASAAETLRALKGLGVSLAIDDFGTGYSSLSYLKNFAVDHLKVDRSFVDGLVCDQHDSAIVAAVIGLADALGLDAVAEGVETERQLAQLRTLGCQLAQGYLFGHPAPADKIDQLAAYNFRS